MSKIKVADFYYGAALSVLFNNSNRKIKAAIIESDDSRQLYELMTDNSECHLFVKYRSNKTDIKTKDYYSWLFSFTERDKNEIKDLIDGGHNLVLALVCGVDGLIDSELALIDKEQVKKLIELERESVTVSRRKYERSYRILIGGGREDAMLIPYNRFNELF